MKKYTGIIIIVILLLLIFVLHKNINLFSNKIETTTTATTATTATTTRTCGKEGHFTHSSGGGKFSWNALRLYSYKGMTHPYLFSMFETYKDGTSDHYNVGIIDLPTMSSELVTIDGKQGVLHNGNFTINKPDYISLSIIEKAEKSFFDMLPCYSGSYTGMGVQ